MTHMRLLLAAGWELHVRQLTDGVYRVEATPQECQTVDMEDINTEAERAEAMEYIVEHESLDQACSILHARLSTIDTGPTTR